MSRGYLSVWIWVRHPDDGSNGDGTGGGDECADGAVHLARRSPAEGGDSGYVVEWGCSRHCAKVSQPLPWGMGYGSLKPNHNNPSSNGSKISGVVVVVKGSVPGRETSSFVSTIQRSSAGS
ncbi:hypothetical protein Tco_0764611 [Tanacetum coccineum]